MKTIIKIIGLIMLLSLVVGCSSLSIYSECDNYEIDDCEKYKCLIDNGIGDYNQERSAETNYLLCKIQNQGE